MNYTDATPDQLHALMEAAYEASVAFRKMSLQQRAALMYAIADKLENSGDDLIQTAMAETHLPEARLRGERGRTIFQWRSYADATVQGDWLEARIDTANPDKVPAKPDIRKMLVGIGPVVVFGSSNFPFAYSTAGGDTATAFAAGCAVVVKAHPAHPQTSQMVADLIHAAIKECGFPPGIFAHVYGASFEVGQALVLHLRTKAVGFTGSFAGGKALFDLANQRKEPIPVFAEMGSVNPVYLLPEKLANDAVSVANAYAGSITLGVGQFCTNPGIIVGIKGNALSEFATALTAAVAAIPAGTMLHAGIQKAYVAKRTAALAQQDITLLAAGLESVDELQAVATIATVDAATFLQNPLLHQEVFGPFSLLVQCADATEMLAVANAMEGQLTSTVMATENDLHTHPALLDAIAEKCGRFILNGVPTGVEVCHAMQHGGPFPAATDSRFTSVGADAIKRFARPIAYQNWPDHWLPAELQNANPLQLLRSINGKLSKDAIA